MTNENAISANKRRPMRSEVGGLSNAQDVALPDVQGEEKTQSFRETPGRYITLSSHVTEQRKAGDSLCSPVRPVKRSHPVAQPA